MYLQIVSHVPGVLRKVDEENMVNGRTYCNSSAHKISHNSDTFK